MSTRYTRMKITVRYKGLHRLSCLFRMVCVVLLFCAFHEVAAGGLAGQLPLHGDNCLYQTESNRPQWQDVGLQDILMVEGQSTVTAPTPARPQHDGAPQGCPHNLQNSICPQCVVDPPAPQKGGRRGSLYMWHTLRL